jgi:hypothetical protein
MPSPAKKREVAFSLDDLVKGKEEINYGALSAAQDPRQNAIIEQAPPQNWQDTVRENLAPILHGLTVAGSAGMGAVTAPIASGIPGSLLGGAMGDQVYQGLQRLSPRTFGAAPQGGLPSVSSSAIETLLNEGFVSGLPWAKKKIGNALLRKYFSPNPLMPIQEGLDTRPGFEVTVPEYTQNKAAQTVMKLFVPEKELNARYASQARQIGQQVTKTLRSLGAPTVKRWDEVTTPRLAAQTQRAVTQAFEAHEGVKDKLYDIAEKDLIPSVSTPVAVKVPRPAIKPSAGFAGQPGQPAGYDIVQSNMKGGVPVRHTFDFAKGVLQEIDSKLSPTSDYGRDPKVRAGLERIKERLETYVKLDPEGNVNGILPLHLTEDGTVLPMMEYNTVKSNKEALNVLLKDPDATFLGREQAIIKTLRDLLGRDTEVAAVGETLKDGTKVPAFWPKEVGNAYTRATKYYAGFRRRYFPGTEGDELLRSRKDLSIISEKSLQEGLSTAQQARQLVKQAGTKVPLATEYVLDGYKTAFNPVTKTWDGQKFLRYLTDESEVGKELLNSEQRNALKYLGHRMTAVMPYVSETGRTAIYIRLAGAALSTAAGGMMLVQSGNVPSAAITGGLMFAGFEMSRQTARNLLLNPSNTRLFSRYVNLEPTSPEARSIWTKLAKGAFRGARFYVQFGNDSVPMDMGEDGKLKPVMNAQ